MAQDKPLNIKKTHRQDACTPDDVCKGWHSRGYLPHFDGGEIPQFITLRLFDTLPATLLKEWQEEFKYLSKTRAKFELRSRIEDHLDACTGSTWLKNSSIASIVEDALLYFDGNRYRLHSWVIMPNHIHFLLTPIIGHGIPGIIHSLKSFTSNEVNRILERKGAFWQKDYYDRYIRNEEHYYKAIEYIEMNPVKAGLCKEKEAWQFSSASRNK